MKTKLNIFQLLDKYGLGITNASGGCYHPSSSGNYCYSKRDNEIFVGHDSLVRFYDPSLFLESIKTTEEALKVKLFI